jgi:mRNA-degrading endonuclease RelE of RelBE toxin-antitoxin system
LWQPVSLLLLAIIKAMVIRLISVLTVIIIVAIRAIVVLLSRVVDRSSREKLGSDDTVELSIESLLGIGEDYVMLKVRVKNRDIQKGKSAGYRLIYQVESTTSVLLLTIYSKSDRSDITAAELCSIAAEFDSD